MNKPFSRELFDKPGKCHTRLFLFLAFAIPFAWLCVLRPLVMDGGETDSDAYYHMKMAELGPSVFCAKKFPWLTMSVWNDRFADKELLFHGALWVVHEVQKLLRLPTGAPFHLQSLLLIACVLLAFIFAMRRMGVSPPFILLFSILMPFIAANFMFRLMMMRPHVLSIAFLLVTCALLSEGTVRFRIACAGGLSFLYAWTYSNPQFIVIPAFVFALAYFRRDSAKVFWIPAAAFAGVMLGLLIHPQFPNSFVIWKVQSFDALFGPLFTDNLHKVSSELLPMEMLAPKFRWHKSMLPFYILAYLTLLCFCRLAILRGWSALEPRIKAVGFLAVLFTCGMFAALRTVEYAVPFMTLFAALVFHEAFRADLLLPLRAKPWRMLLTGTLAAILLGIVSSGLNLMLTPAMVHPADGIGKWMRENIPPETTVVNLNWGDFPTIFHANDRNYYLWGMDPVFSFALDGRHAKKVEKLLLNIERVRNSDKLLGRLTHAKYAVLLAKRENFVNLLKRNDWKTVYESKEGAVFLLE